MATPLFLQDSGTLQFDPSQGSDWDTAFINGEQVPGLVRCSVKTTRKVDVSNSPGVDSASIRFQGIEPAAFSLEIVIWTPQQQADIENLLAKVAPVAGRVVLASGRYSSINKATGEKKPASFSVYHPALAAAEVSTMIVESVAWYGDGPAPQSRTVTLECRQVLKTKNAIVGTTTLDIPNTGGVTTTKPSQSSGGRGP